MLHTHFLYEKGSATRSFREMVVYYDSRSIYLCNVGNILPLLQLKLPIHLLPVVGHGEDGICSM